MLLNEVFTYIILQKGRTILYEWFRECYKVVLHKIVSLGLICEIKFGNIPSEEIKVSCKELDDHIERIKLEGQDVVGNIQSFAQKDSYGKYLCRGNEVHTENIECVSHVAIAGDIITFSLGVKHDTYSDDMADSPKAIEIIKEEIEKRKRRGKSLGELKGNLPIIWVTKSSELENLKQDFDSERLATAVVDRLGMAHITRGYLIEIQIPLQSLEKLHTPTIIDASFGKYFFPAKESDRWGRTLQIQTLQRCLPEAVHPSLALEMTSSFLPLGMLNSPVDEPDIDMWKSFYTRMIKELVKEYPEYEAEHEELFGDLEGYNE